MEARFYNAANIALESDYRKLSRFVAQCGNWERVWDLLRAKSKPDIDPDAEWKKLGDEGVEIVMQGDPGFPKLLLEIPYPPFGIYVKGTLPPQETIALAVVGTRKATPDGISLAERFSEEIARAGVVLVSGLAYGIDISSHRGALKARGKTVAVLGNGLDRIYPRAHEGAAKKIIAQGGALVSEYPLGCPSLPHHFIERNRLVSGLSRGVLVIEAPNESGALHTARFALEQNRDVFVVPGSVRHPNYAGSHALIRAGAQLVSCTEELLDAYGIQEKKDAPHTHALSNEERILFDALRAHGEPLTIDKLMEATNLNAKIVIRTLGFLALKNIVQENERGYRLTS